MQALQCFIPYHIENLENPASIREAGTIKVPSKVSPRYLVLRWVKQTSHKGRCAEAKWSTFYGGTRKKDWHRTWMLARTLGVMILSSKDDVYEQIHHKINQEKNFRNSRVRQSLPIYVIYILCTMPCKSTERQTWRTWSSRHARSPPLEVSNGGRRVRRSIGIPASCARRYYSRHDRTRFG